MYEKSYSIKIAKDNDFRAVTELWKEFKVLRGDDFYPVGAINLSQEIASLPAPYNQQGNAVLLVKKIINDIPESVGCVSLKKFNDGIAEVRRMYVKPEERGNKLGLKLMEALIAQAKSFGYKTLYLDSLNKFKSAHALYEGLGFSYIAAYDPATTQDMKDNMIFMKMDL